MSLLSGCLAGCRLQADRYVLVSVIDLRRLRCDRVVMKLLFRGSLVLRFRHRHSLHEVMQVQIWTVDMRNLLAVCYQSLESAIDPYTKVLDCRPADIIQYNSSRRGYAILRTCTYRRVLAHWLLEIQISRSRSHHAPCNRPSLDWKFALL